MALQLGAFKLELLELKVAEKFCDCPGCKVTLEGAMEAVAGAFGGSAMGAAWPPPHAAAAIAIMIGKTQQTLCRKD